MQTLNGLRWKPKWVSQLGCLQGCLDYLGVPVSDAWLFGISGHAFVINIHEELCPSGPTAWKTEHMTQLCQNTGCKIRQVSAYKSQPDFTGKRETAWQEVRQAIDQGKPCCAWELKIPEFYVIHGYDETGYYFNGPLCDDGCGPLPWDKLADTGIGWLNVSIIESAEAADPKAAICEALCFAQDHARHSEKWTFPGYATGLEGYQLWIASLEEKRGNGGAAYNAAVWSECRQNAPAFLVQAKSKLDERHTDTIEAAIGHYEIVAEKLRLVADLFPFLGVSEQEQAMHLEDDARRSRAIDALRAAYSAEELGLGMLDQLANEL
ncbi:MAG: hypothetical protein P8Z42_03655 [Anaerolineales bacterium]